MNKKIDELQNYQRVQSIAKSVLIEIQNFIKSGVTEKEIADHCKYLMTKRGVERYWYHNVPALVLVGKRTLLSISGRQYEPSEIQVTDRDLVTIDLSPEINGFWGDCARSFVILNGKVHQKFEDDEVFWAGIEFEKKLHSQLKNFAKPETTLEELYLYCNNLILESGYINLDFNHNLGHSIEKTIDDRRYIEKGCKITLEELDYFTFEPHICLKGGKWGFKHENIYYFKNKSLHEL